MELTWALVGRAGELQQGAELMRAGRQALVLAGPAGVGKTRLASECLRVAAGQGYVPVRVAATQGAAGLPFGAFAALVPDVAPGEDFKLAERLAIAAFDAGAGFDAGLLLGQILWLQGRAAEAERRPCTTSPGWARHVALPRGCRS